MITKMLKAKPKTAGKEEASKKKKHQLEKVKKAVKAELVEVPEPLPFKKVRKTNKDAKTAECDTGPEQTVFVGNLPSGTHRAELSKLFAPYGKIMFIHFFKPFQITDNVQAYFVLDSVKAADEALELNHTLFKNKKIFVRKPEDTQECSNPENSVSVKFKNSDKFSITKDILHQTFSSCGDIEFVTIYKCFKTLNPLLRACVQFKSSDAVDLALEIKSTVIGDIPIKVQRYCMDKEGTDYVKKRVVGTSENTVFVKNLKNTTTDIMLKNHFSSCGELEYVKVLKQNAFVCFKSPDSVSLAFELNDTILDGQPINVETYKMKPKHAKPQYKKKLGASSGGT